ncbi:MAG TPA: chromate resistance protein ChrB domain-containing protein [Thermodesulfobacteriota bacterium]|nr:chromate resistance protein ChrB domain-containing protein [Thermodesulfobacteriota bacterium]
MKWITRENVKVDRVACPWLIRKFIDPQAEFLFVPKDSVLEVAEREGAIPFDVPGVELGHHGGKCSFEAIIEKYNIEDTAIRLLAKIVHGADVAEDLYGRPEVSGLKAIAEGFRHLGLKDDHEILEKEFIVYDALYAYCRHKVAEEKL